MKHWQLPVTLVCLTIGATGSADAGVVAVPPSGPARVAKADAVIVGKVVGIEPEDKKVGNQTYRIAVVRIEQGLKGIKDEKRLRIGFIPVEEPKNDGKGPFVVRTGARPVQLQVGKEGLFVLTKQAKEDFFVIGGVVGYFINGDKNQDFAKEVQVAKAAVKVAENSRAALKAKDATERLLGAAILIEDYRTYRGSPKQEAIDAAESKQILEVLADADSQALGNFASLQPTALQLFQRLGVGASDGFVVPPAGNYPAAVRTWLRDNVGKYRIQRFVAGEAK
jgi:hypothetical protein